MKRPVVYQCRCENATRKFPGRKSSAYATGSGKTIVMAMLIAWHILNKVIYPQDKRFCKNIFVVAPGLTVKSRLQVLVPAGPGNYYDEFNIVPAGLWDKLRQGNVLIRNWHALAWDTEEHLAKKKSVDKRGAKSDEAYVREVLGEMATARNLVVINGEAHHAWRVPAESKVKGITKADIEEATKWIGGLDRIHRARGVLTCYDLSATPFAPSGKQGSEEVLFSWIVSDFGLNDAIEAGLVKTPRVVVRDDGVPDARTYKSKLYHIYQWVRDDLNRKAEEQEPLPDLVVNGYYLLSKDWLETARKWGSAGFTTPPVMITVANRTETAAQIKYAFDYGKIRIDELIAPERTWYTGKPCAHTTRSHINQCVFDSTWEASEAFALDHNANVAAWVKNDHLGFEILYIYTGVVQKFRPDFLIRLTSGTTLVLEVKGQDSQQHQTKREFLDEWARAVNQHGGFGRWAWDVSRDPADISGLLQKHNKDRL